MRHQLRGHADQGRQRGITAEGSSSGTPLPDYFGQKTLTNNATASWDVSTRATLALTYRYRTHTIAEGIPHNAPLAPGADSNGTVLIHENGGILNVALRPTDRWTVNGTAEVLSDDNAFTPVGPRQTQVYRLHSAYRPKTWATVAGSYLDTEHKNNTNNTGTPSAAGPLEHVDHSRTGSIAVDLSPSEHYGFDFTYAYSDVYTSTNICYDAASSSTLPGAASASGTACPGASVRGQTYYEFGPVKGLHGCSHPVRHGLGHRDSEQGHPGQPRLHHQRGQRQPVLQRCACGQRQPAVGLPVRLRALRLDGPPGLDLEGGLQLLRIRRGRSLRCTSMQHWKSHPYDPGHRGPLQLPNPSPASPPASPSPPPASPPPETSHANLVTISMHYEF